MKYKKLIYILLFVFCYQTVSAQMTGSTASYSPFKVLNNVISPQGSTWTLKLPYMGGSGTRCVQVDDTGLFSVYSSGCSSGGGVTSYDAFTHPAVGQSATTSLMIFNGNATSTGLTVTGSTYLATSGGNVGIGLTAPTTLLQVSGGDIAVNGSGGVGVIRGDNVNFGTGGAIQISNSNTASSQYVAFGTTPSGATGLATFTEKMRILSSGNVGIGTTSPAGKLQISNTLGNGATALILQTNDSVNSNSTIRWVNNAGTNQAAIGSYYNVADAGALEFLKGNTTNMLLTSTGNLGIGYTTGITGKLAINGNVGIGTTGPFVLLANTATAINDGTIGANASSLGWATAGTGYNTLITNTSATANSNGLLVKTADVSAGTFIFNALSGANLSRMVITGSGNVGIGTTSPSSLLNVYSSNATVATFERSSINNATAEFKNTAGSVFAGASANNADFGVGISNDLASALFLIKRSGNVGIGTTSPTSRLFVQGSGATSATSAFSAVNSSGTSLMTILNNGNVGVGTTSPYSKLSVAGQVVAQNYIATSTTSTSQIGGVLFSGVPALAGLGTSNSQLQISQNLNNLTRQLDLANISTGANAASSLTFENANSTNLGASSAYIAGLTYAGPNFSTAGFGALPANGIALYNTDGGVVLGSASANSASSTVDFYAGNNGGFAGGMPDMTLRVSGGTTAGGEPYLGLGTTSPKWKMTVYSSTTPQISLGDKAGINIWSMRNAGGNLYIATSSPTTYATSTKSALAIDSNGFLTISANSGTGCAQFDTNGKLTNTGSACGSSSGASDFTFPTNFGAVSAATSTPLWLQSPLYSSSTVQIGTNKISTHASLGFFDIQRDRQTAGNGYTLERIRSPLGASEESTLSLVNDASNDNSGVNESFIDFYNENYSDSNQSGIRVFNTGTAKTKPFLFGYCFPTCAKDINNVFGMLPNGTFFASQATSTVDNSAKMYVASSTATYIAKFDSTPGTNVMSILSNGNVGVGTSSPWGKLSIGTHNLSVSTPTFTIASSSTSVATSTQMIFVNGNLGIGTTSPSSALSIGTTTGITLSDMTTITSNGIMIVEDQKTSGTAGGSSVAAVQDRTLNTVVANTILGASLSSNQITLPSGTYTVDACAPAFISDKHKVYWFNVTDNATTTIGRNSYNDAATNVVQTDSCLSGYFTITASKVFKLRHYTQTARATNGLGVFTGQGTEVYSQVKIRKQ